MPIDVQKTTASLNIIPNDIMQKKTEAIVAFFHLLHDDKFEEEIVFSNLFDYIKKYDRILYAPISNEIYSCCQDRALLNGTDHIMGAITSNIDKLLVYVNSDECKNKAPSDAVEKKHFEDTRKAVMKIWDHINLAQQQYAVLKQSDEEYQQKFEDSINPYKEEMTKDMNSQLLTMVSIFTALAFLVFGGISSLDNIFSTQGIPLLKLMCVSAVWGLCILNLIFVFLFCISKMTNLSFKSTNDPNANIFQKYPVIWWTDLILLSILALCSWAYHVRKNNFDGWLNELFENYRPLVVIAGTLIIVWMIWKSVKWLTTKTSYHPQNSNK